MAENDEAQVPKAHLLDSNCPHCGFAMIRELEMTCRRCGKSPDDPVAPLPSEKVEVPLPPATPETLFSDPELTRTRLNTVRMLAAAVIVVTIVGGIIVSLFLFRTPDRRSEGRNTADAQADVENKATRTPKPKVTMPRRRSRSERRAGQAYDEARKQVADGQYSEAIKNCTKALEYDSALPEAALLGGIAWLGIPRLGEDSWSLEYLSTKATWGDTKAFDMSDAWLEDAVKRCNSDLDRVTQDEEFCSNKRIKSIAQTYMSVTAFFRAVAALKADQFSQMNAWLEESDNRLAKAEVSDPDNPLMKKVRILLDDSLALVRKNERQ